MTPSNRMPRQRRAIAPALDDPVRIVPLHAPREVFAPAPGIAAPPSPQLTYRGGPLLGAVQVFTVFWGAAWNDAPQLSTAQSLNRFLRAGPRRPGVPDRSLPGELRSLPLVRLLQLRLSVRAAALGARDLPPP